jgi:formylglycine-generating enzyme required for sulfatase activity
MVRVPTGSFQMGSPAGEIGRDDSEGPVHTVTINYPLAVSKYPVTRGQWRLYVESMGQSLGKKLTRKGARWLNPGFAQDDQHPVVSVTWSEAEDYVKWLRESTRTCYRLLSEAEWEYAARAGTTTAYYWGDEIGSGHAQYVKCGSPWDMAPEFVPDPLPSEMRSFGGIGGAWRYWGGTAPVGSFAPNPWGLYDMLGNVREWMQDCWNGSHKGAPADGSPWTSGDCRKRVLRGGSWHQSPHYLRAATRNEGKNADKDIGFRLARTD